MDGKHSMRLQNVNVYVWTGPKTSYCVRFNSRVIAVYNVFMSHYYANV